MNEIEDGRVEDGEAMDCLVCGVRIHMYFEDAQICWDCQQAGWEWIDSQYVRRGDVISVGGKEIEVDGEERMGLRVMLYADDGRVWSRRVNSPMLVRR